MTVFALAHYAATARIGHGIQNFVPSESYYAAGIRAVEARLSHKVNCGLKRSIR
jgi:hypothetical protein